MSPVEELDDRSLLGDSLLGVSKRIKMSALLFVDLILNLSGYHMILQISVCYFKNARHMSKQMHISIIEIQSSYRMRNRIQTICRANLIEVDLNEYKNLLVISLFESETNAIYRKFKIS